MAHAPFWLMQEQTMVLLLCSWSILHPLWSWSVQYLCDGVWCYWAAFGADARTDADSRHVSSLCGASIAASPHCLMVEQLLSLCSW
jgi:hypothetical protein